MPQNRMYQVSTLQALALGYSRAVVSAGELLEKGDCGLGTFTGVDGEMIVMDGQCFRADQDGHVSVVAPEMGIPFAAVATLHGEHAFGLGEMGDIEALRAELTERIEGHFGLNSMHVARIDGDFEMVDARSESPYHSHHVTLKEILGKNQRAFVFDDVRGSLVGVYFPDYMDGINMPGWHLHFLSAEHFHYVRLHEIMVDSVEIVEIIASVGEFRGVDPIDEVVVCGHGKRSQSAGLELD